MQRTPQESSRRRFVPAATLFAVLVIAVLLGFPYLQSQRPLAIPDPVLRAGLHEALNIPASTPLTASHLARATYLDLTHKTTIRDLTGLEAATSLTELRLTLQGPEAEPAKSQLQALRSRGVKVEVRGLKSAAPAG